jgi:hypothetical protein
LSNVWIQFQLICQSKEKSLCDFRPENCRFFNCVAQEFDPST